MGKFVVLLLLITVVGGGGYVGRDWARQQAFLIYSQKYARGVNEFYQTLESKSKFPHTRTWFNEIYYQRRWDVLSGWGKKLIEIDRKLRLQTEFAATVEKFWAAKSDFREQEKLKFFGLELKQLVGRLPPSKLPNSHWVFPLVALDLVSFNLQIEEHKKIDKRMDARLSQLEVIFQGQQEQDNSTFCTTHKTMTDRQNILNQMKQRCLDPANAQLPMCLQSGSYFQTELDQLQKLDQWNIDKLKQRWPQWREPACTQ